MHLILKILFFLRWKIYLNLSFSYFLRHLYKVKISAEKNILVTLSFTLCKDSKLFMLNAKDFSSIISDINYVETKHLVLNKIVLCLSFPFACARMCVWVYQQCDQWRKQGLQECDTASHSGKKVRVTHQITPQLSWGGGCLVKAVCIMHALSL